MSRYTLHFEWPAGIGVDEEATFELHAETFDLAKMQAAMLYACAAAESPPPIAYRIVQNGETEVYLYPEPTVH